MKVFSETDDGVLYHGDCVDVDKKEIIEPEPEETQFSLYDCIDEE